MSISITIQLSDTVIRRALRAAHQSERDVEEILVDWLGEYARDLPVESLSDEEILALCEAELSPTYQYELRSLLYNHRYRQLTRDESVRLDELLRIYRKAIIRKVKAFQIATIRGLK